MVINACSLVIRDVVSPRAQHSKEDKVAVGLVAVLMVAVYVAQM